MKLFAVYIGGEIKGCNIELHDMRFVIADSIEEAYPELRRQWWGTPSSLHLDCWAELTRADGYKVTLQREPQHSEHKLFYVNLGGYDPAQFTELHKNVFVVAENEAKAKARALKTVSNWGELHKDNLLEAEKAFCISDLSERQHYIHLEKTNDESPAPFTCLYKRIGK